MRRTLVFKLTISFVLLSVIVLGLLNSLGSRLIYSFISEDKKNMLYSEATLISSEYKNDLFRNDVSLEELNQVLSALEGFIDAHIWVVNMNGNVICNTSGWGNTDSNVILTDYYEDLFDYSTLYHTNLNGLIPENSLCVIYPIPYNYKLRNYLLLFVPDTAIESMCVTYTNMLTLFGLFFLGIIFIIFIRVYYMTVYPLRRIRNAAMEYAKGHFEYETKVRGKDEFYDVASALNYMATELQNLDNYQKKFIANISHDFRSPLTSIKGYAEAMQDGTIPPELQSKYFNIIVFEAERLNKLTNHLLELNSFDNNRNLLKLTSFDINQVIKQTCSSFEGICMKKKIQVNLVFSEKETIVTADYDKIQQVLYNLIDNALKFSPANSNIRISSTEKGDKSFISIKDYGVGIPKASIHKIWERFYKQDSSRGKDKSGTGLGLSIVKEIIQAHNENIDVISTEGVGTEFTFTLTLTA